MCDDNAESELDCSIDAMAASIEWHNEIIQKLKRYSEYLQQLEIRTVVELDRLQKRTAASVEYLRAQRAGYCRTLREAVAVRNACDPDRAA